MSVYIRFMYMYVTVYVTIQSLTDFVLVLASPRHVVRMMPLPLGPTHTYTHTLSLSIFLSLSSVCLRSRKLVIVQPSC